MNMKSSFCKYKSIFIYRSKRYFNPSWWGLDILQNVLRFDGLVISAPRTRIKVSFFTLQPYCPHLKKNFFLDPKVGLGFFSAQVGEDFR